MLVYKLYNSGSVEICYEKLWYLEVFGIVRQCQMCKILSAVDTRIIGIVQCVVWLPSCDMENALPEHVHVCNGAAPVSTSSAVFGAL